MAVYQVCGAVNQDASGNLYWLAWCEQDGEPETGATDCTVTLYESDGDGTRTAEAGQTETVASPDASGVFNGRLTPDLTPGKIYYLGVALTADAVTRNGIVPLGIQVRTT